MKPQLTNLPKKLWAIRDAVVEHFHSNAPLPSDYVRIYQWLEDDGWDDLIANEEMALNLGYIAQFQFSDSEFRAVEELDSKENISDSMRIHHARKLIAEEISGGDNFINPSIHCVQLVRDDGKSSFLGCIIEIHGQSGPVVSWLGFYPDHETFLQELRRSSFVFWRDLDLLEDSKILSLWEKGKK